MSVEASIIQLCDLVESLCGVALDPGKTYLLRGRLRPLLEEYGFQGYADLTTEAKRPQQAQLRDRLVDALTTNETLFFRDRSPFNALREQILPEIRERSPGRPRLRIWSAACSTGQEPYSIAMTLRETLRDFHQWDISIMATDVSPAAIERARSGSYAQHEIDRGVTPPLLSKYFRQDGNNWQINDEMRRMVRFAVHNLLRPPPAPGPYDLIFCRNVTIYFKKDIRRQVFERLAARLTPEGYLFVGCSESLHDLGERFRPQRIGTASVYQPNAKTARV